MNYNNSLSLWNFDEYFLKEAPRTSMASMAAGTDQFSREALKQNGVRLASARGVNARAVSEHVMALMLALARRRYQFSMMMTHAEATSCWNRTIHCSSTNRTEKLSQIRNRTVELPAFPCAFDPF